MVGLPGLEPGASASRTQRATKLRHSPWHYVAPENPGTSAVSECSRVPLWVPTTLLRLDNDRPRVAGGAAQLAGVDRLHEHTLGLGAPREEVIRVAIEE
jgi:hypothetical protein